MFAYFDKCILCKDKTYLSREHIFPQVIGGMLNSHILCQKCNSKLGSTFVNLYKKDPFFSLAIFSLKEQLPSLYHQYFSHLFFRAKDSYGKVYPKNFFLQNKAIRVRASKLPDGEFIIDLSHSNTFIRSKCKAKNIQVPSTLQAMLESLKAEEDFKLSDKLIIRKPEIIDFWPELEQPNISDNIPALIGFEILALLIGNDIFEPQYDKIRFNLRSSKLHNIEVIRSRIGNKIIPYHSIEFLSNQEYLRFRIRYFGWLGYDVAIKGIEYQRENFVYIENLIDKSIYLYSSREDAKQGHFIYSKQFN